MDRGVPPPPATAALVAPPRPDLVADRVRAYVRSRSARELGVLFGLMLLGVLVGYLVGPHDRGAAVDFARSQGFERPTFATIFAHNLGVVGVPILLFPVLFWRPFATAAVTGFAVGQLSAAWFALGLPGDALAAALIPHGVVEVPATLVAGVLAWRLGRVSWGEDRFGGTWRQRARAAFAAAGPMLVLLVVAVAVAAYIEAEVTPRVVEHVLGL